MAGVKFPRIVALAALLGLALAIDATTATADDAHTADEQAITEARASYVQALKQGDAEQLLSHWTPDGDFVDDDGRSYKAQELIRERFAERAVAEPGREIEPLNVTLRFVSDDVAIEDATSQTRAAPEAAPSEGRYTALWVKREGRWLLGAVREFPTVPQVSVTPLTELDWMVGHWHAEHEGQLYDVVTRWNEPRTYLIREFKVQRSGEVMASGQQVVGWDAAESSIRSWVFDSQGGYSEGTWTRQGDAWAAQSSGVLPDGRRTSALNLHAFDGTSWTMKSCQSKVGDDVQEDLLLTFERVERP